MVMISLSTSPACGPRFLAGCAPCLSSRASQNGRNAWQKSSNWQKSSTSRSNMNASAPQMAPTQKEELTHYKGLGSSQTHNSGWFSVFVFKRWCRQHRHSEPGAQLSPPCFAATPHFNTTADCSPVGTD